MVMAAPELMSMPFDLLVLDAQGTPVIAVEVKSAPQLAAEAKRWLHEHAGARGVPYGIVFDPESLQLFDVATPESPPLLVLPTRELLAHYAHGLDSKKATERYLLLLVDTWLRNVMQPLAADPPPALERLQESGIFARIRDGQALAEWRGYF